MITKYRNRGIVLAVLAFAMTVLFLVALRKSVGLTEKGYDSDALGRILIISLLLGFCCQPAALIFPFLGFSLEDKTQSRKRSSRRRHDS